jgi:hypothetical protein
LSGCLDQKLFHLVPCFHLSRKFLKLKPEQKLCAAPGVLEAAQTTAY